MRAGEIVVGSLLGYLAPADREFLVGRGVRRRLPRGEAVMHEGDPTDHVLILLSGWVRVYATTRDGGVVLLALRGPGDVIGDLAALQNWPRTANVESLQEIRFAQLRAEEFTSCLHHRPAIAVAMVRQMAQRLREAESTWKNVTTLDVARRVATHLLQLTEIYGKPERSGLVVRTPLTQQDIADRIGASRRGVARALATLRERGVVRTGRQMFVVAAPEVLRSFAESEPPCTEPVCHRSSRGSPGRVGIAPRPGMGGGIASRGGFGSRAIRRGNGIMESHAAIPAGRESGGPGHCATRRGRHTGRLSRRATRSAS